MKKILILSLSALAFTGCMKQYNCACTPEGIDSTFIKDEVKAVSVHRAHEKCYRVADEGETCMAKGAW